MTFFKTVTNPTRKAKCKTFKNSKESYQKNRKNRTILKALMNPTKRAKNKIVLKTVLK